MLKNPSMDIKQIIAANLEHLRKQPDGSLEPLKSVAKRSGVSFSTIQRASRGEINITIENLEALARAYRRLPSDLLQPIDRTDDIPSALANYLLPSPNMQTGIAAADSLPSYKWPFPLVSQSAYEALPPEARAYVQGCMKQAIDEAAHQFGTATRKRSA